MHQFWLLRFERSMAHTTAATLLGFIQRAVRCNDEIVRAARAQRSRQRFARRYKRRDPDACCHVLGDGRVAVRDRCILEQREQTIGYSLCACCVCTGKQQRELLTAIAGHAVSGPRSQLSKRARESFQTSVACWMSVVIIEGFEVIDVDQHQ